MKIIATNKANLAWMHAQKIKIVNQLINDELSVKELIDLQHHIDGVINQKTMPMA